LPHLDGGAAGRSERPRAQAPQGGSQVIGPGRRHAIDFHAHLLVPEVYAVTAAHSMFVKSSADPDMDETTRERVRQRDAGVVARMADVTDRISRMDAIGIERQVLSASLVHQCTYW